MHILPCRHVVACCLLLAAAAPAQPSFRQTIAFGDSLTNNDLFGQTTGDVKALYGADPMEAVFNKAAVSGDRITSYAVPGVKAAAVQTQLVAYAWSYLLGQQPLATTISFEGGGNDVLAAMAWFAQYGPGPLTDPITDAVRDTVIADLVALTPYHPNACFVVWTIPDLTLAPASSGVWSSGEQANIRACVARINGALRTLDTFPNVVVWDLEQIFQQVIANPPVLHGRQLQPPPAHGKFDALFADPIHPNAVFNALIANALIAGINPRFGLQIPQYTIDELAALARIP